MEKMIKRDVKVFTYTFVKVEEDAEGMKIVDSKDYHLLDRLGERKVKDFINAHDELKGYVVGKVTAKMATYQMKLTSFVEGATLINAEAITME